MQLKKIKINSIKKLEDRGHVYDLHVPGNHNFFIGKTQTLTHNCDFMTANAQAAMRNIMEEYHKFARFILTANYPNKIIEPIRSRCQHYRFVGANKKSIGLKAIEILTFSSAVNERP